MDIRSFKYSCKRCGQEHSIEVDFDRLSTEQRCGSAPVFDRFVCDRVARMYRVMGYALDTRTTIFNNENLGPQQAALADSLKDQWGAYDFDAKLERFKKLGLSYLGIPEEYYELLRQIVDSYCSGYFYPSMTAAGALGERVLNRLLLRTRAHFSATTEYKSVYRQDSFDNWEQPISVLQKWHVISAGVAAEFRKLKQYRNDSIHYREGYPFEQNACAAISHLAAIINQQFNYMKRDDLFWVFNVPGEIWVRSTKVSDPFVREFVLPHCAHLSAYCEPSESGLIQGVNAPLAPLSDEDFLKARADKSK